MMNQINLDHEKWERSKALHAERQKRYREKYKVTSRDALPIKDNNSNSTSTSNSTSNGTNPTSSLSDNSGKAAIGISDTANSQKEAAAGPIFSFWQSEDATMQG
jgi:hypothetical protein